MKTNIFSMALIALTLADTGVPSLVLAKPIMQSRMYDGKDSDLTDWKQRPEESFKDGAKSFQAVKDTLLKAYFDSGLTEDDLFRAATQGMLEHLDRNRWNKLYSPSEHAVLKSDLNGEVVGVGLAIQLDEATGIAEVLNVISGSPSEKAGVRAGDRILSVAGKSYKGKSLPELVRDLRGKAGTEAKITLLRGDVVKNMTLRRDRIVWAAVDASVLPNDIGMIVIRSFQANTTRQLKAALERMKEKNVRGLVLDLRGNVGGKLDVVKECGEVLLPKGKAIVTIARRGDKRETFTSNNNAPILSIPVAVLVNSSTASGAEILTAALKSGLNASIVGEHTFGKWNTQELEELPNKFAFKYTTGLFYSPDGETYQGQGLDPDVPVAADSGDIEKLRTIGNSDKQLAKDAQLRAAHSILKLRL